MTWQGWINFVAGLWLILSAFLNFTAGGMVTNLVITGIVVAVLSLWEGYQYRSVTRMHSHA